MRRRTGKQYLQRLAHRVQQLRQARDPTHMPHNKRHPYTAANSLASSRLSQRLLPFAKQSQGRHGCEIIEVGLTNLVDQRMIGRGEERELQISLPRPHTAPFRKFRLAVVAKMLLLEMGENLLGAIEHLAARRRAGQRESRSSCLRPLPRSCAGTRLRLPTHARRHSSYGRRRANHAGR